MNLNADLVRARRSEIEESLRRLERFKGLSRQEFLSDQDTVDLACYRLLVAIEAALALCYHVSAKRLQKVPEEYAHCFELLHEAGVISSDHSRRLQKMARFRSPLIQMYWKVDSQQVYHVIQHDVDDLRAFSGALVKLL